MALNPELTEELRGVQRSSNQFGEPWGAVYEYKVVTMGALPTGSFTTPAGCRALNIYNRTYVPVMIDPQSVTLGTFPTLAVGSYFGAYVINSQTDKLIATPNTLNSVAYSFLNYTATLSAAPTSDYYTGGALVVSFIRP